MIDIKNLRKNPDAYKKSAKLRGVKVDIDKLLQLDLERSPQVAKVDELRAELNIKGKPDPEKLKALQKVKKELETAEKKLQELEKPYQLLLSQVPNLIPDDTPEGGEESNREERTWGEALEGEVEDHQTWLEKRDMLDFERGAKVAGNKFYYLKGSIVKLEMAVKRLAMDVAEEAGFTPMEVPHLVTERIATGTGFNPKGNEQQIYSLEGEDLHLIATAEIPLTGYHADEIIDPKTLPLLYVGLSPSYRREAGAYGKYSRGLYRVHQFNKLELYVFSKPAESQEWLKKLVDIEEQICQKLEIPYRVTRTAAGDMGAPHYQKYDVEYWSPVEKGYRELTSASNCTDYQARRLSIRTREDGQTVPLHTLNATAAATSRMLIALIENHQINGGKVAIPKALQAYYDGEWL